MRLFNLPLFCTVLLFLSCHKPLHQSASFISVQGRQFIDAAGRQIIFHGAGVVNKKKSRNYLGPEKEQDFAAMREWGFNVVRLGVIWDGIEPQPGVYDEAYLQGVDQRIEWARQNNIYVFLDMHQDLYSVLFSDGAPQWATLTDGLPHLSDSPVWSDAYFSSPAVQRAWDHFWDNSPAPDGTGLQDHYAATWAHVAERYAADTTVIAYDLMNEPFMGSEATQIFPAMLTKGAQALAQTKSNAPSVEMLAAKWMTVDGREEILNILGDIDIYKQVIDATQPIYSEFEKSKLMPMYQRVAAAIRRVDEKHILFLETTMGSNMGVYTAIEPLVGERGERDAQQAYAPHGYDLVTDTPFVGSPNSDRVDLIFSRHNETAQRLNMPMLVGEWGAYGRHKKTFAAAAHISGQFEKYRCSDTYWDYTADLAELDHFRALSRPYPQRIAGLLQSYDYHVDTKILSCRWDENQIVSAPTIIYIPARLSLEIKNIKLDPADDAAHIVPLHNASKSQLLVIPPTGESTRRQAIMQFE